MNGVWSNNNYSFFEGTHEPRHYAPIKEPLLLPDFPFLRQLAPYA